MTPLLTAWLASLVLITYREMPLVGVIGSDPSGTQGYSKGGPCPTYPLPAPIPAMYAPTFVVFGALGVIATADRFRPLATLTGWGFVAAMALNVFGLGKNACEQCKTVATPTPPLPAVPAGTPQGPASSPTGFPSFPPPGTPNIPGRSPTGFAPFITTGP